LQAKIADGRAKEAEQRMEILQVELLQSQVEVKRLLDRLNDLSRDKQEMVSGKVHAQLLQLSDERAESAERRIKELELEISQLKANTHKKPFDPFSTHRTTSSYHSFAPSSSIYPLSNIYPSQYTSTSGYPSSSMYSSSLYPSSGFSSTSNSYTSTTVSRSTDGYSTNTTSTTSVRKKTTDSNDDIESSFVSFLKKQSAFSKDVSNETASIKLPSLEEINPVSSPPSLPPIIPQDSPGQHEDGNDSSSDWSSSSDEEDNSLPLPPPPTHAATLQPSITSIIPPPSFKRTPPPVAPKPKLFKKVLTSKDQIIESEKPVSFEEPPQFSSLLSIYSKPPGPKGRRLPSSYYYKGIV
jgi:hypothetical protein